jgi:predicted translation initiation factor SUI1
LFLPVRDRFFRLSDESATRTNCRYGAEKPDWRGYSLMETIHLRIEKKGRGGKTVTVLEGFTHDLAFLENLASNIKQSCGTGGTLRGSSIEIQGDFRLRIREILCRQGFELKG